MTTLVVDDDLYIYAIWFQSAPNKDWMGHISRRDGEPFKAVYRFRYYVDRKVFDSDDEKNFMGLVLPDDTEEQAELFLETIRAMGLLGEAVGHDPMEIVYIRGRGPKHFLETTKDVPWMHSKTYTKQKES